MGLPCVHSVNTPLPYITKSASLLLSINAVTDPLNTAQREEEVRETETEDIG